MSRYERIAHLEYALSQRDEQRRRRIAALVTAALSAVAASLLIYV
ncbi:MAG: hypothetical protein AB8G99_07785 [Planctomycetaceae bacterium]